MGIFDVFSGKKQRLASMAQLNQLSTLGAQSEAMRQQGLEQQLAALDAGQAPALSALQGGYGTAINTLQSGLPQATGYLQPYYDTGREGFERYADATGLNGPEGYARAYAGFQESPWLKRSIDTASEAVARRYGAAGKSIGGGNTMAAIADRAAQTWKEQEYQPYLNRLQNIGQTGFNAATGLGSMTDATTRGVAGLQAQQGVGEASLYDTNAARRAAAYGGSTALGLNSLLDLGKTSAGITGQALSQSPATNQFNALMSALKLAGTVAGAAIGGPAGASAGSAAGGLLPTAPKTGQFEWAQSYG